MVRVSALRNAVKCEPPSTVLMLLAKLNTLSLVGIVVLQRHFHGQHSAVGELALAFKRDRLVVQRSLVAIQVLDELGDAAA